MEEDGINHFDAWGNMFGAPATNYEMNSAGNYEPVERFSRFVNIPELMSRVSRALDWYKKTYR
jgi:N12 class adenine-specific DNA methylase